VTQDELWAGPQLKNDYAFFHLMRMQQALAPPELEGTYAAMAASGTIVDSGWQRKIGPYFDAFLGAARSIPGIIECCFGRDTPNKEMKRWFDALPADEQDRRDQFSQGFKTARDAFAALPLSKNRNTSVHRRGYAPYEISIPGRFGLPHTGGPTKLVPLSETPIITDPNFPPALARPWPIQPHFANFTIEGKPLFQTCQEYLNQAGELITESRQIVAMVYGASLVTAPPDA
jgi:hypothetical protein